LLREKAWVRITARTIEVFHRGKRVAAHVRLPLLTASTTTVRDHMLSSHRRYADWTPERLRRRDRTATPRRWSSWRLSFGGTQSV
jgi:hypothetical protein